MKAGSLLAACAPPMPKGGSTIGLSPTDAPYGFAAGDGLLYATVLRSRGTELKNHYRGSFDFGCSNCSASCAYSCASAICLALTSGSVVASATFNRRADSAR